VYRELERNACNDARYRVSKAISRTTGRRSRSRRNRQFSPEDFKVIKRYIRKKWSPMQIASTLRKQEILFISHETIYKYLWADKASDGSSTNIYVNHKRNVESAVSPMIPEGYSREGALFPSDLRPSRSEKASGIGRSTRSRDREIIIIFSPWLKEKPASPSLVN